MILPSGSPGSVNQHTVEEDAEFLTPPEHHPYSHLSSSEDQNPNEYHAEGMAIAEGSTKVRVSEAGLDDEPEAKRVRMEGGEELEGETVPSGETEAVEIGGDQSVEVTNVVSDNGDSGGEERDTLCLAEGSSDITGEADVSGRFPPSLKGREKEAVGDWEKWEKKGLLELLDDLKAVLEDTEEDNSKEVDIVETAKKNGGTFPRPRWWPPEGEDWSYG